MLRTCSEVVPTRSGNYYYHFNAAPQSLGQHIKRNRPQRSTVLFQRRWLFRHQYQSETARKDQLSFFRRVGYFDINVKTKQPAKISCSFSKALVVLTTMSKRNSPQRSAVLFQRRWLFRHQYQNETARKD